jgi:uncharacterized protein YdbL (DUF1318 family)
MKYRILMILALLGTFAALPAFAMTLDQARSSGSVGEKTDGYVAALRATPEVKSLVADVNAKRQQEYQRISKQNSQNLDDVAKLAAQQIINKLPSGAMYQAPDGWKAK